MRRYLSPATEKKLIDQRCYLYLTFACLMVQHLQLFHLVVFDKGRYVDNVTAAAVS